LQLDVFILYPGNDILELEIARTIDGPEYPHFPWIPVAVIFAQRREGISKKGRSDNIELDTLGDMEFGDKEI
jgi:hypothetical protein